MIQHESLRTRADVIIVGAGPAGAVTALLLVRAGLDVLVLDRAAFPRPKPCGDCLSFGTRRVLDRLGLLDAVLRHPHAQLRGWRIVAPDGAAFDADFDGDGAAHAVAIERAILDDVLIRAACAAGARLRRETVTDVLRGAGGAVIGVRTRTGSIRGRLVIGADGLRSVIASRLGARGAPGRLRKLSLTLHVRLPHPLAAGEMHIGGGICAGLAPVAAGRGNLTVVADSARYGRAVARDPRAFADAAVASLPMLRAAIDLRAADLCAPLASGPFDRPTRRIAFDGAVLVGDAAGYYDPFTGQGVHQALVSAELLAPAAARAVHSGDTRAHAFHEYVRARSALVGSARTVQRAIEFVISRPALANRAIRRIHGARAFGRALLAVTGDTLPPRALLSPQSLASLLFPAAPMEDAA